MSTNSYMVFSGTNSRYLAEKICAELNCPHSLTASLKYVTKSPSVAVMCSSFSQRSPVQTI